MKKINKILQILGSKYADKEDIDKCIILKEHKFKDIRENYIRYIERYNAATMSMQEFLVKTKELKKIINKYNIKHSTPIEVESAKIKISLNKNECLKKEDTLENNRYTVYRLSEFNESLEYQKIIINKKITTDCGSIRKNKIRFVNYIKIAPQQNFNRSHVTRHLNGYEYSPMGFNTFTECILRNVLKLNFYVELKILNKQALNYLFSKLQ